LREEAQLPISQLPIKLHVEMPKLRSSELVGAAIAVAVAARLSRALARFMQSLLLALHESRLEKARREIHSLRHLLPTAKEVTYSQTSVCGGGGDRPTHLPARRPAEARREPSQAA
jgi:hypothetical protein